MFRGQLFLLLVTYVGNSSCAIASLYDTGKELWKLYSMLDETYFDENQNIRDLAKLFIGESMRHPKVGNAMNRIHEKLDGLDDSVKPKVIRDSFQVLPFAIMLYKSMDTFDIFTSSIDEYYGTFRQYMNDSSQSSARPLQDLTSISLNVQDKIQMIRKIVTQAEEFIPDHHNLVFAITDYTTTQQAEICNVSEIISNILIRIFKISIIAEIKVNIIMAFANIHRYAHNGLWKLENSEARRQFQRWFGIYFNLFPETLEFTDGLYARACDPDNGIWIRNESFYELEGTFQTMIFRDDYGKCGTASCNAVLFDKTSDCDLKAYDERLSCSGPTMDCYPLFAMHACVLKDGPYKFHYVNLTASERYFGRDFECPKDRGYIITDGITSGSNDTACACNCYGNHNKISLSLMESRTNLNMVITGLRFFRENNILYIQPREGKLDSDGRIYRFSNRWVPIPSNSEQSHIHTIDRENNVFFLDDVRLPPEYVLTGVKWNKVTRGAVEGFAIEIFGVPFDYKNGKLILYSSTQISNHEPNDHAGEDLLFEPISSHLIQFPHTVTSAKGYISLVQSGLQDDFGQATLPFFDVIRITPNPSLLGGIGIFYKGIEGYAGFISMRVYGIPYANYFRDFMSVNIENGTVILDH